MEIAPGAAGALAEELSAAAAILGGMHPLGGLFYEDREDLRVVVDSEGHREIVQSRLRGLAARSDPATGRGAHVADPAPGDPERLVAAVLDGAPPEPRTPSSDGRCEPCRLEAGQAVRTVERVIHLASLRLGRAARLSARWVGYEQAVLVARADGPVRSDTRRARRLRLEVLLGEGRGSAVAERVLKPGQEADLEKLAAEVTARALERADAQKPKRGETPVIFAPGAGGILLHEIVGHALEADTVERGGCLLASRQGPVALQDVTVLDDPRRGRAAWRMDDEGFDSKATPLLQEGRLMGLLHSEATARRGGKSPTGHGRKASFHERVLPRMGCTFLAAGPLDPEEVVDGTAEGVLVRRMEAASVDPRTGEAVFRITDADAVLGGRVREPLSPFHLYVTTLTALARLDRVGSDIAFDSCVGSCVRAGQAVATSVGAPTFRIGVAKVLD